MAEEVYPEISVATEIAIKVCTTGFVTKGNRYGGEELHAFSTPESLIEWLSRELGAGPIVWSLTLDIWRQKAEVEEKDLTPLPDIGIDPLGYQEAVYLNAVFLLNRFVEAELKARQPEPPPEPKVKKEKKVKGEKPKAVFHVPGDEGTITMIPEEEKPKE